MKYDNKQLILLIEQIIKETINEKEILEYYNNFKYPSMLNDAIIFLLGEGNKNIIKTLKLINKNFPKIFSLLTSEEEIVREEYIYLFHYLRRWIVFNDYKSLDRLKDEYDFFNFLNPIEDIKKPNYLFRGLKIKLQEAGEDKVEYRDEGVGSSWTSDIKVAKSFTNKNGCIIAIKFNKFNNLDPIIWEISNSSELSKSKILGNFKSEKEWVYSIKSPIVVDLYSDSSTQQSIQEDGEQNNYGFIQLPQEGEAIVINNTKVK